MTWIFFALLAPFTWAIVNVIDRLVMIKIARTPSLPTLMYSCVGIVAALVIYVSVGFSHVSLAHIGISLLVGISILLASFIYFTAIQQEEISRIVPLLYFVPLYVSVLAAIFLGEIFSPSKYIGIVLLILGATFISYRRGKFQFGRPFWLMLLAAVFWASAAILEKYLVETDDVWTIYAWVRLGSGLAAPLLAVVAWRELRTLVREHGSSRVAVMGLSESMSILAQLFIFFALSLGPVSLVAALGSVQSFFVLVLTLIVGFFWPTLLQEEGGRKIVFQKVIAILIMFLGAYLVI